MSEKEPKYPLIYCFLDTNIFIEFELYTDINWREALHAKKVCLVLAPVVLHELDKKKTDMNDRVQKRARMLLPKLRELLKAQATNDELPQIKESVTFMALQREPHIEWREEGLDPNINDDRLIASMLEYKRKHPSENVILVSDDNGPISKAMFRNIPTLTPEEPFFPPVTLPTDAELEVRKLKKEVQKFTERMPQLRVGFHEQRQIADKIIRQQSTTWLWQTPEEYVQEAMAQRRELLAHVIAKASTPTQENEAQEFAQKYEKYLTHLEQALTMQFFKDCSPFCRLQLIIVNEGSAPARGVGIEIIFPEGTSVITLSELDDTVKIQSGVPEDPAIPRWAVPNVPSTQHTRSLLSNLSTLSSGITYTPPSFYKNTYFFDIFPFNRNMLNKKMDKLSHHEQWTVTPLFVYLPPNTREGFSIQYSLYADEILEPIDGELKVTWE